MKEIKTTGQLRELLISQIQAAADGKLSATDGKNLIGLANQITTSMAVELKAREMQIRLGNAVTVLGALPVV